MLWSMSNQLVVSGSNFVIGIAAARYLGIAEFGKFTLILMIATFANMIHDIAVTAPMMTLAGNRAQRSREYFAAVAIWGFALAIGFGLAVLAIAGAIYSVRGIELGLSLGFAVFAVTAFQSGQIVVRRILFARQSGHLALIMDLARFALFAALLAGGSYLGHDIDASFVILALGVSALPVFLPTALGLFTRTPRLRLMREVWGRHWRIARWLVLMLVVSAGHEQLIWIGVSLHLGDEAVGAMRAGTYLLGATHFIVLAMENFLPRQAAEEMRRGGLRRLRAYLTRQTAMLCAMTLPIILLIAVPAEFWLGTLFGSDYARYASVLYIYAVTYAISLPRTVWSYYLRSVERTDAIFRAYLVSSAAALALAYPAITELGLIGAALDILLAHVICICWIGYEIVQHTRANDRLAADQFSGSGESTR